MFRGTKKENKRIHCLILEDSVTPILQHDPVSRIRYVSAYLYPIHLCAFKFCRNLTYPRIRIGPILYAYPYQCYIDMDRLTKQVTATAQERSTNKPTTNKACHQPTIGIPVGDMVMPYSSLVEFAKWALSRYSSRLICSSIVTVGSKMGNNKNGPLLHFLPHVIRCCHHIITVNTW